MTAAAPSLGYRVLRSSSIIALGFGASMAIRLASNLILTRLLFPEAFGLMALVTVFLVALTTMSDIGIGPTIMQSPRGDDPSFLDTAWTIQIARGALLAVVALAATPFVARFYGEPQLRTFLPVMALALFVASFRPTRFETANRHLQAGRVTLIDLAVQVLTVAISVALAFAFRSVWALVIANFASSVLHLALVHLVLPGHRNRLGWDRAAAAELIHFGKWILLSTFCGFAVSQADKVILGRYLDLGEFGLYNISYFLASIPILLGGAVMGRVLIPVYRDSPPAASPANAARVRRLRSGALAGLLLMSTILAFGGGWLVRLLYDPRYHEAAGMVVLIAVMQAPALLILSCDQAALAMGDSRRYFRLTLARAILVTGALLVGFEVAGLAGAIVGQGLANLAAYPFLAWLLRPHGAWMPGLDAQFLGASALIGALALWSNHSIIARIF
jgi:O-antigen/teichoic acid export membrane protein